MADAADIRMERLPKWAQQRIRTLENHLAHAQARIAERGPEDSFVRADPYADPPLELGDPSIEFSVGEPNQYGRTPSIQVRRSDDGRGVYIMGSDTTAVFPQSSNTFTVKLVGR